MATSTIQIPVEPELAETYYAASDEERRKVRALLILWLRDLEQGEIPSLPSIMDRLSDRAQERGLTPDILETLLTNDE